MLALVVGLGLVAYRGGTRRARERAERTRLEAEVAERTAEIEAARTELEAQADALRERTDALDAALATQEALVAQLQEATDTRARAFAGITHDLRTPLAVVVASLDGALSRGALGTDDREEVGAARRSADVLGQLSDALSEAAQHETGRTPVRTGPLDVAALARDVVAEQAVLFERREQSVSVEGDHAAWAEADARSVRRVLTNLLDNARRYAPEGGGRDGRGPGAGRAGPGRDRGPGHRAGVRGGLCASGVRAVRPGRGAAGVVAGGAGAGAVDRARRGRGDGRVGAGRAGGRAGSWR